MFSLIKLIQSLVGALHSEGTPGQLAAGIVLGSFLGLTPLVNIHNAVIFAALVLLNVSFAGGMLGWALSIPFGFLLDPLFDWIGHTLLFTPSLTPVFTSLYNMPVIPLTNFNNTVVLGSSPGRDALSRHDRSARAAVAVVSRGHGVQGLQRLQAVPPMTASRPQAPAPSPRFKVFRWRALGPLLILFVIAAVLWWLFADTIARRETQKVGTQVIGAKVEIQDLHLDLAHGKVLIRGLTVASPHEALRNLLQADELVADVDVVPLTEKKLIINRIAANGLRFGTPRETDGRVAAKSGVGIAGRVLAETHEWASQFQVPAVQVATGT